MDHLSARMAAGGSLDFRFRAVVQKLQQLSCVSRDGKTGAFATAVPAQQMEAHWDQPKAGRPIPAGTLRAAGALIYSGQIPDAAWSFRYSRRNGRVKST